MISSKSERVSERNHALEDLVETFHKRLCAAFPEFAESEALKTRLYNALGVKDTSDASAERGEERYAFEWLGRQRAEQASLEPSACVLKPCRELSRNWETTEHIYINGDNLDALKLLKAQYCGCVRMIYIDPPYNSGADRMYNDRFRDPVVDQKRRGRNGSDANRKDIEGRNHSRWLSMMYARLRVARDLLAEDGAIFISIDDHEHANLRRLCDEIFGSENYICCFVWDTKKAGQGMATAHMVVNNHEYIYVYAKNGSHFSFKGVPRDPKNGFSNPDNDPRGPWKRQYLQRFGLGLPERTVTDPKTGIAYTFETPYTQEKLDFWVREARIIFPRSKYKYPVKKEFLNEYEHPQQLTTDLGLFSTKSATEKLYDLFGGVKIFANAKPVELIRFLVSQATRADRQDIVLDFFSGSATTAHAVMQLNAEDSGNRRFIMVQMPESCSPKSEAFRAGCRDIFEIGRKRILLAGDALKATYPDLDIGFRVFLCDKEE
ncbi:MAG: site-specific DNA-methyltransferase [Proteobacteria bacterium]|nr:site-specific DNA-methyltransferase [Pseudomonadota bacterium]